MSEGESQRRLLWGLKRLLPATFPSQEHTLKDRAGAGHGRADIFYSECIVIEMKRAPNAAEVDRAVGQVTKYARYCKVMGIGPVLLVLCEIDDARVQRLVESIPDGGDELVPILVIRVK